MEIPVQHRGPGFGPVQGYLMPSHLVEVFFAARRTAVVSGVEFIGHHTADDLNDQ